MKRGWAVAVGVSWIAIAAEACEYYAPLSAPADAGADAAVATSSSSSGAASSSSGDAGFVRQPVPPWAPSFLGDASAGDVVGSVSAVGCPSVGSPGPLSGAYVYSAACFDTVEFARPFAAYCPNIRVVEGRAALRVNGGVDVSSGAAVRNGTIRVAAEVYAPCRGIFGGTCAALAGFVASALGQRNDHNYTMQCYDQSPTECTCQLEDVFTPDDGSGLPVDSSAGTLGGDYVYGVAGNGFTFTGRPVAEYTSSNFTVDPAFVWTLRPAP